MLGTKKLLIRM